MKRLLFPVALLAILSLPLAAQEQPSREPMGQRVKESAGVTEHGAGEVLWGWANFLILAVGLGYVIKKNVGPYFAKRSLEIRKGIVEAEAAQAESDARVAEVDRRLAHLHDEIAALHQSARQEAEAEAERSRREAAAEMAKIQSHVAEEIAAAAKSARLELRRYSAELALSLAGQKIAARLTPETQDHLVMTFVAGMASRV
ncbi:MAG TPA: ATP synthase F0 subunit B [Bryobacteraceae bacterium]|nr:ATP synthase F0 subunit B [Bryobacteraceae bacterium]